MDNDQIILSPLNRLPHISAKDCWSLMQAPRTTAQDLSKFVVIPLKKTTFYTVIPGQKKPNLSN